ncbi:MAG: pirin family protein [Actinobacteria bacterium]|nr:pirin family protein [Actinomycetota bacterium]
MSEQARTVERVITPQTVLEGAGVRLRRSIATPALDYVDPFLLFDHFGSDEPADYVAGFPWHPHRGIETVTYMLAGEVDHRDSIGNAGRIGPGDVQWMTAGGGIMHEEMPRPGDDGRRMGGFQLWVNLPSSLKMSHPRYQDLSAAEIPEVRRGDGAVIRVVAGEVDGVSGAVTEIYAEPEYLDVSLPAGGCFVQPVPRGHAALAYAFEGEGRFGVAGDLGYRGELDGVLLDAPQLAVFGDGDEVRVEAPVSPVRFLLIGGRPLGEPIARYGPFVMNSREEIILALRDLQNDTFVWRDDPEWAAQRRTWSPDAQER